MLSGTLTAEASELKGTLEYALASRKTTRKRLRKQLTDDFKAKKLAEQQKNLQSVALKSRATHKKGAIPKDTRAAHEGATKTGMELIKKDSQTLNRAIEGLDVPIPEEAEMDAVDLDAISADPTRTDLRQQPSTWEKFGDDEAVAIEGDQAVVPGVSGAAGRAEFVKRFMAFVS